MIYSSQRIVILGMREREREKLAAGAILLSLSAVVDAAHARLLIGSLRTSDSALRELRHRRRVFSRTPCAKCLICDIYI